MTGLYVDVLTKLFESQRFIVNTTLIKILFWNEYSDAIYQNPQTEIFKV